MRKQSYKLPLIKVSHNARTEALNLSSISSNQVLTSIGGFDVESPQNKCLETE